MMRESEKDIQAKEELQIEVIRPLAEKQGDLISKAMKNGLSFVDWLRFEEHNLKPFCKGLKVKSSAINKTRYKQLLKIVKLVEDDITELSQFLQSKGVEL